MLSGGGALTFGPKTKKAAPADDGLDGLEPDADDGDEGEDAAASAAFDAVKAGDRGGFKSALLSAVRQCVQKEMASDYDEE